MRILKATICVLALFLSRAACAEDPIVIDEADPIFKDVVARQWAVAFSHDGKWLATTGGWDNPPEPGELVVWNLETQRPALIRRQNRPIRSVAFAPDGKRIAIGDFEGKIRLLDATTGKIVQELPKQEKIVNGLVYSPSGESLVSAGFDGRVIEWNVGTGKSVRVHELKDDMAVCVTISRDGKQLAASTWHGKAHVWNFASGEKLCSFAAAKNDREVITECVAFSPDGKTLMAGSWDGSLRSFDAATGKLVQEFAGAKQTYAVAFSDDGTRVFSTDAAGTLFIWHAESGDKLDTIEAHDGMCFGLAFSRDGKHFATTSWDRTAKIWDYEHRKTQQKLARPMKKAE